MIPNGLDVHDYTGEGYHAEARCGSWLVAIANAAERFTPEGLTYIERHMETDEVFVLLEGEVTLYIGIERTPVKLERGKIYNVRRATWHAMTISPDGKVLIVENSDTCRENSEYMDI